jgi:hypothetical protein
LVFVVGTSGVSRKKWRSPAISATCRQAALPINLKKFLQDHQKIRLLVKKLPPISLTHTANFNVFNVSQSKMVRKKSSKPVDIYSFWQENYR